MFGQTAKNLKYGQISEIWPQNGQSGNRDHRSYYSAGLLTRIARFIFSEKVKPSVKKGQKRPTKLLKKAKHSTKRAKPFTWPSQIY